MLSARDLKDDNPLDLAIREKLLRFLDAACLVWFRNVEQELGPDGRDVQR